MRYRGAMLLLSLSITPPLLASCSGGEEPVDGTVDIGSAAVSITSLAPGPSTSSTAPDSPGTLPATTEPVVPTTRAPNVVFPEAPAYEVVGRSTGDSGDILVVLLDHGSYSSLSDIDLHGVIADVYDRFPPVFEAHIVDDQEAAEMAVREGAAAVASSTLSGHYLARLEEGYRIVFLGRFEEFGTATLGS